MVKDGQIQRFFGELFFDATAFGAQVLRCQNGPQGAVISFYDCDRVIREIPLSSKNREEIIVWLCAVQVEQGQSNFRVAVTHDGTQLQGWCVLNPDASNSFVIDQISEAGGEAIEEDRLKSGSFHAQSDFASRAHDSSPSSAVENNAGYILVAEDDPDQRKILEMMFRGENLTVHCVKNGIEALAEIKAKVPMLIVTDLMMPGMSGIELVRALNANPQYAKIPVLVLTVLDDESKELELFEIGVKDYCAKTTQPKILMKRIRNLLSS